MGDLLGSPRVASLLFVLLGENATGIFFFLFSRARGTPVRVRVRSGTKTRLPLFFTRSTRTPRASPYRAARLLAYKQNLSRFFLNAV